MIRRLRLMFAKSARDFQVGDPVRRVGYRGVGFIESINGDHATVAWDKDARDILPLFVLRLVPPGAHSLDSRAR